MQPRSDNYQYVFNIQTTGLEPENGHRIIEIACIKLKNGADTGEYVHLYINPEGKTSDPAALAHHLIADDFLSSKPLFAQVVDELMQFLRSEPGAPTLIMHNAGFAKKFLALEMKKAGKQGEWDALSQTSTWVDTWVMAVRLHQKHNKLDELAAEYTITSSNREAGMHKADILAKLYPILKQRHDARMAQKSTAANAGLFGANSTAAAKPDTKRPARKNAMGHPSHM